MAIIAVSLFAEDKAVRIGNPLLARFPLEGDARPRSVWDLQRFDGKIYIGSGDYWANTGPTDIWTYDGSGAEFRKEFTVDEEMVWVFFEFQGKLFVPGYDPTEGHELGNLYIRDPALSTDSGWTKLRTMPRVLHCFEVAYYKEAIYATVSTSEKESLTLVSNDMGLTWNTFLENPCSFAVLGDFLFLCGEKCYVFNGKELRPVNPDMLVRPHLAMSASKAPFRDGLLYYCPVKYIVDTCPLYFLSAKAIATGAAASMVPRFAESCVRDLLVRDGTCYILVAEEIEQDKSYRATIYSSENLDEWRTVSNCLLPGVPVSFEELGGSFYIGLGSRYDFKNWDKLIGDESGSIWRVQPERGPGSF
jgi:hypothetical protein